jgi:hypothetical protein
MDHHAGQSRAAVGFAVKSGWAAAVLVSGTRQSPRVLDSRRIDLSDPAIPESRQPYHTGFGTARLNGPGLSRLLHTVRRFGTHSLADVIQQYAARHRLVGAGVVVGSLIDPELLGNAHIRIHALEGRLFRSVVEDAALDCGLRCFVWRERDLYVVAAEAMNQTEPHVRATTKALGKTVAGAWRAEQKAATVAAWTVLATSGRTTRSLRLKAALSRAIGHD